MNSGWARRRRQHACLSRFSLISQFMVFMAAKARKTPSHLLPKSDHKISDLWHSTQPSSRVRDCEILGAEEGRLRRTQLNRSSATNHKQSVTHSSTPSDEKYEEILPGYCKKKKGGREQEIV